MPGGLRSWGSDKALVHGFHRSRISVNNLGIRDRSLCPCFPWVKSSSFSISLETAITRSLPPMEAMTEAGHPPLFVLVMVLVL